MRKNKMLSISERCEYNDNKISTSENFSFLSIISFIVIISFKFIVKNSDEESFDMNSSKDIKKNQHRPLRHLRKR